MSRWASPARRICCYCAPKQIDAIASAFAVDHSSPYYHEENKGLNLLWRVLGLTHYLELKDYRDKTDRLTQYAQLLPKTLTT